MKNLKLSLYLLTLSFGWVFFSCSSTSKLVTVQVKEYGFAPEPINVQEKSDISISLKMLSAADIYDHPELFSFTVEEMNVENVITKSTLETLYPVGPQNKQWENPFVTQDGNIQMPICFVKVENKTNHILRMGDARIYLLMDGVDPIKAISSIDEIKSQVENVILKQSNKVLSAQRSFFTIPEGLYETLVDIHKKSYKLINDLSKEILPGFSYEGLLVFPAIKNNKESIKISFFDVTTKTDQAGNPIEKTQFDFEPKLQTYQMWYDRTKNMWIKGTPPKAL